MSLLQKVYSVLLVSASDSFNATLLSLMPSLSFYPVHKVKNVNAAKRLLTEKTYDMILINAPLPGEDGLGFAIDCSEGKGTVVLLMVQGEYHDEIYSKVSGYGIFTLPKPFSRQLFITALNWLVVIRERLRSNEQKEVSLEEKMNEIRLINRAKWLLIRELKMDEAQAHRYIEKQAMDRCLSKREIAEILIKTYS